MLRRPIYTYIEPCCPSPNNLWDWKLWFCANPNAVPMMEQFMEEGIITVDAREKWSQLCENPMAIPILKKNIDKINWYVLCKNPYAIEILKKHPNKIYWDSLCENPNPKAMDIIEKYINTLFPNQIKGTTYSSNFCCYSNFWCNLVKNPHAIHIIEKYFDKIMTDSNLWKYLCENPNAMHIIKKYKYKIKNKEFTYLCGNPNAIPFIEELHNTKEKTYRIGQQESWYLSNNPNAISFLEKFPKYIDWFTLSENPNAIPILEKNIDKIFWTKLCYNINAIPFIKQLLEKDFNTFIQKIGWGGICRNPNGIDLINLYGQRYLRGPNQFLPQLFSNTRAEPYVQENCMEIIAYWVDKEHFEYLSEYMSNNMNYRNALLEFCSNSSLLYVIFPWNYNAMREKNRAFAEELASVVFHPTRMMRLCETYGLDWEELNDKY